MQRNEHLRRQRIERNWRQQDLADQLGATVVTIQRWERGLQRPSAYYGAKLCSLFGLSAQELGLVDAATESRTGEVAQIVSTLAEESAIWTVPYARNPHFTGRDDLLQQLEQQFAVEKADQPRSVRPATLSQAQALTGLGGIGKTQIAVEYAYRARIQGRYRDIIWILAASDETIQTSFVELAHLLPALVHQEEMNQLTIVTTILRWLEQRASPWLLIFDNAADLSQVQPYLPHWGNGNILFTTRANAVGALASSIEVDTMGVIEGAHLLLRRAYRYSGDTSEEMNEAINIVIELAQFPLAIDQAGAYIEETRCSLSTYLQLYQQYRNVLLARRGKLAIGYPESVVTTWSLSFVQVERSNPAAAELLRLCAFLAPDHIPEELLTEGGPYWPLALREAVANPLCFNQMLETLLAFSLVKRLAEDRVLSLHRLVQVVQMERMEEETQHTWAQRIVSAINALFPLDTQDVATWSQCLRYLEQVEVCDTLIQQHHLLLPEAGDLLDRAGTYFREHMWYAQAEPLYRRALAIREHLLGREDPHTATTLHNLAILQRDTGNVVEAELLCLRALAIRERQLGPDHLHTAATLHNLANLYLVQRRYREAEPLYQRALSIREQHFGRFHLDSDDNLHTLANFYLAQGKYREAEPVYQSALYIREQHFGSHHYRTANILNNLALLYTSQRRYVEGEPLYRRVLAICEQQFGPDHPNTATSLYNLANLQRDTGNVVEAESLYQRAQAIREQHLGETHPAFADCLSGLATLYQKQGDIMQAEALAMCALRIHEQQFGPFHPSTADDLHTLAILYRDLGRYEEAVPLFVRALKIREQMFAATHLSLAETVYEFALLRHMQGHNDEARVLYERAQAIQTHILGATDPQTIKTHQHLVALLSSIDRAEELAPLDRAPESRSTDLPREIVSANLRSASPEQSAIENEICRNMPVVCPQCHQTAAVLKSGKNRSGSQRFRCHACHLYFTPQPNARQPDQMRKAEAQMLAEQGMSYRHIARQLNVHHQTVSKWISAHDVR